MESGKSMTENESLELISSMINKAKNRFNENGFMYLVWGWAVLVLCIAQFVTTIIFHMKEGYMVWILVWIVAIYSGVHASKKKRKEKVKTYTDEIVGFIWVSFLIGIFISIFICIQMNQPLMITPSILVMYGFPIFLSGGLMKYKPLVFGGLFCWILAIASPFVKPDFQILLAAAAIAGAWIVPGYMLRSRYKKETGNLNKEI